ncbi:hypothetical protein EW146_g6045 [Bondarzewia mesenterica]|uniref:Uncharacterized protein n=1 Tax=Bondarzewia mesenterica TaxID=1095465 RepID=A0A4S4LRS4_9AGAM|nr:hypothetical protein EW146_g6045 [Bondarzewia mesenterica]
MSALTARIAFKNVVNPLKRASVAAISTRRTSTRRPYSSEALYDSDADIIEREKRRSLSHSQYQTSAPLDDAPGWNETLASPSEADVKADRSTRGVSIEELARRTVAYVKAKDSPDERPEGSEAQYERDEISGPLRGAGAGVGELETDEYEEDVDKVDGEWQKRTMSRHTEVLTERVADPTESEEDVILHRLSS